MTKERYEIATFEDELDCTEKLHTDALDLINRQNAEIERLEKENTFHRETIQKNAQKALGVLNEEIETARVEAIKEFAERLKELVSCEQAECEKTMMKYKDNIDTYYLMDNEIVVYENMKYFIDNLVKEMTEGEK